MVTEQLNPLNDVSILNTTLVRPATMALNQQLDESMRCKRRKIRSGTVSKFEAAQHQQTFSMTGLHESLSFSDHSDPINDSITFPQIDFSTDDDEANESFLATRKRSITCLSSMHNDLGEHMPHGMVRSRTVLSSIYRLDSSVHSQ